MMMTESDMNRITRVRLDSADSQSSLISDTSIRSDTSADTFSNRDVNGAMVQTKKNRKSHTRAKMDIRYRLTDLENNESMELTDFRDEFEGIWEMRCEMPKRESIRTSAKSTNSFILTKTPFTHTYSASISEACKGNISPDISPNSGMVRKTPSYLDLGSLHDISSIEFDIELTENIGLPSIDEIDEAEHNVHREL